MKLKNTNTTKQAVLTTIKRYLPPHIHLEAPLTVGIYIIDVALQYGDIKLAITVPDKTDNAEKKIHREDFLSSQEWIHLEITDQEWCDLSADDQESFITEQIFGILPKPSPQKNLKHEPSSSLTQRKTNKIPQDQTNAKFFKQTPEEEKDNKKATKSCCNCWGLLC